MEANELSKKLSNLALAEDANALVYRKAAEKIAEADVRYFEAFTLF